MRHGGGAALLLVLAAAFVAGAAAGALTGGSDSIQPGEVGLPGADGYESAGFARQLLSCCAYHLFVLLFSTSLFGVLIIPAAMAVRGFTLACSAAYIAAAYPGKGPALALAVLGLPAIFTVPSLFVAAQAGVSFSLRLLASYSRRPAPAGFARQGGGAAAVSAMLLAAASAERWLVPALVRLII